MSWMNLLRFRKKEDIDKNIFKVNLGNGIESLSYEEMQYRFRNLTEHEEEYLYKNIRHCNHLSELDLSNWNTSNVTNWIEVGVGK